MWNVNPRVRAAYIDTIEETIEIALGKGVQVITMHMNPGVHFSLPRRRAYLREEAVDQFLDFTAAFAERVARLLAGTGVRFCIENTGVYRLGFIARAVSLLLEYEVFGLTWDIDHDHCSGNSDGEFINRYGERVHHLQQHDAMGSRSHLALGDGDIDLRGVLSSFPDNQVTAVLESKTSTELRRSVQYYAERFGAEVS